MEQNGGYSIPCIRNWALPIGAFQDQCKQIMINKHNLVKNPNWQKADQLAIYKCRRKVELGAAANNREQPYVKDVVSGRAAIYIRPIQSKLDLEKLVQPCLSDDQVKTQCVNCKRGIPTQSIKEHFDTCPEGSSGRSKGQSN